MNASNLEGSVMPYSVALLPPPWVSAPLAAIRAGLDPEHAVNTTPHITLKQPYSMRATASHEAALARSLSRACARHASFPMTLEGVSFFESPRYGCVLYIGARDGPPLHRLSSALVHAIADLRHETPGLDAERENQLFLPHLTLAQGLRREDAVRAQRELVDLGSYSFEAERVVIGRCGSDGVWATPFEFGLPRSLPNVDVQ